MAFIKYNTDLCFSLTYFLLAVVPKSYQGVNKMFFWLQDQYSTLGKYRTQSELFTHQFFFEEWSAVAASMITISKASRGAVWPVLTGGLWVLRPTLKPGSICAWSSPHGVQPRFGASQQPREHRGPCFPALEPACLVPFVHCHSLASEKWCQLKKWWIVYSREGK